MQWLMKMMHRGKKKHGFTLVELMIVVVIVGILAAVALALYRGYMKKAMGSEGKAGLGTMRTGLRVVMAEKNAYDGLEGVGVGALAVRGGEEVLGPGALGELCLPLRSACS